MNSNNLNNDESKTLEYYNKNAKEWLAKLVVGSDNLLFEDELNQFNKLLSNGKILEIGCGAGNDAKWFIQNGYEYTGIDASSEMISLSKSRVPNGAFQVVSIFDINFPDKYFDGFWSSLTLYHFPKAKILDALKKIAEILRADGVGFISIKEGTGEKFEEDRQRFYAYYSVEEFEELLKKAGFEIIQTGKKILGKTVFLTFFVRLLN
jgi:SAM-dependent methyltransferase